MHIAEWFLRETHTHRPQVLSSDALFETGSIYNEYEHIENVTHSHSQLNVFQCTVIRNERMRNVV